MKKINSCSCLPFYCLLAGLLFLQLPAAAQYTLRLKVNSLPQNHEADSIFVAGNFNNWNPGDTNFLLKKNKGKWELVLQNLATGLYKFKFTRGSWNKAATSKSGSAIPNEIVKLSSDSTIVFLVDAWQDDFSAAEKKHTASKNVQVIDTSFFIPQLKRSRRISIYLPASYSATKKQYPVLYMHDGQNIFDEFSSGYGEWGVDEALDTLTAKGQPECIVVAIDNGPQRLNEYNPFDNDKFGKGEGKEYAAFLVHTLKPFIDKHYRTHKDKEHTLIAGSSMGGLISYYTILAYPGVFGKAGIFSPAFWTAPGLLPYTDSISPKLNGKLFFYIGGLEGDRFVEDMYQQMQHLGMQSAALIYGVTDPDGRHNEAAWRKWFPEFYKFMMADWSNYVIPLKD